MKTNPGLFVLLAFLASPALNADVVSDLTGRAERGDVAAQLELAGIYAKGEGVARDQTAATCWILKAAEQGDWKAQVMLGRRYLKGEGVPRNVDAALKWFSKAAEQGNNEAQMALGGIYVTGKGLKRNSTEAARWFLMSAEQGNPAAQCQMGRMHMMHMMGAGVSLDDVEAYKWSALAAAQGHAAANKILMVLRMRMTSERVMLTGHTGFKGSWLALYAVDRIVPDCIRALMERKPISRPGRCSTASAANIPTGFVRTLRPPWRAGCCRWGCRKGAGCCAIFRAMR